jgi:hypothetical protein
MLFFEQPFSSVEEKCMKIVLGPVLGFRGVEGGRWLIGALVVVQGPEIPALHWRAGSGPEQSARAVRLAEHKGRIVWRLDLAVAQEDADVVVRYEIGGASWSFTVPAAGRRPRLAFASCNGFSSLKMMKSVQDNYALWKVMAARHSAAPYHLLLMGGDQVYADEMWETVEALRRWNELPPDTANNAPFGAALEARVRGLYFDLYLRHWSQPEVGLVLATVPTLMMWDDHDIFDGWGSYPPERHASPMFQGIFRIAREHFRIFQRQEDGENPQAASLAPRFGFSVGHRIGDLALVVLDMRSERRVDQVLSQDHWDAVLGWIDGLRGCRQLLVMSSIPVIYPSYAVIETALGVLPGQQEIEDDLRDHWTSRGHRGERLRLFHRLLAFSEREATRVTLISGDVHVGALGILESSRSGGPGSHATVINQLISSGIVHPGSPGMVLFALEHLLPKSEEVDRGLTAEMVPIPGTQRRYLGARNFLSLEPDRPDRDGGRIWAHWICEGETEPYTKVIHPVE